MGTCSQSTRRQERSGAYRDGAFLSSSSGTKATLFAWAAADRNGSAATDAEETCVIVCDCLKTAEILGLDDDAHQPPVRFEPNARSNMTSVTNCSRIKVAIVLPEVRRGIAP